MRPHDEHANHGRSGSPVSSRGATVLSTGAARCSFRPASARRLVKLAREHSRDIRVFRYRVRPRESGASFPRLPPVCAPTISRLPRSGSLPRTPSMKPRVPASETRWRLSAIGSANSFLGAGSKRLSALDGGGTFIRGRELSDSHPRGGRPRFVHETPTAVEPEELRAPTQLGRHPGRG